jgi:hypothetical protein
VIIWHLLSKDESYAWTRPSLHAKKLRDLELKAGHKAERGQKGAAQAYNTKSHRDQEGRWVEQAETAYARFVAGWNPRGPKRAHARARNRGAAMKAPRQGSRLTPALRQAVVRAQKDTNPYPARKHLSITSVVCGLLVLVRVWSTSSSAR